MQVQDTTPCTVTSCPVGSNMNRGNGKCTCTTQAGTTDCTVSAPDANGKVVTDSAGNPVPTPDSAPSLLLGLATNALILTAVLLASSSVLF
jgi:hypothetical protein